MARFFVWDIKWDRTFDGDTNENNEAELPAYAMVWLPGYQPCSVPEDDYQAVLDKLSDDFGFCVSDCKIVWIDNLTQTGELDVEFGELRVPG